MPIVRVSGSHWAWAWYRSRGKLHSLDSASTGGPPHHYRIITTVFANAACQSFHFEPSPGDKSRPSKLALSLPACHPSMEGRAKAASPKGQTLSAPADRTGWDSGSDLLQRNLERWCQLVDILWWISHQAQGKEHRTRIPGCKACPSWATNRLKGAPPIS